jgi:hypothetical protein
VAQLTGVAAPGAPPGWYVDPWNQSPRRWWDGSAWTGYLDRGDRRRLGWPPPGFLLAYVLYGAILTGPLIARSGVPIGADVFGGLFLLALLGLLMWRPRAALWVIAVLAVLGAPGQFIGTIHAWRALVAVASLAIGLLTIRLLIRRPDDAAMAS